MSLVSSRFWQRQLGTKVVFLSDIREPRTDQSRFHYLCLKVLSSYQMRINMYVLPMVTMSIMLLPVLSNIWESVSISTLDLSYIITRKWYVSVTSEKLKIITTDFHTLISKLCFCKKCKKVECPQVYHCLSLEQNLR